VGGFDAFVAFGFLSDKGFFALMTNIFGD